MLRKLLGIMLTVKDPSIFESITFGNKKKRVFILISLTYFVILQSQ